ncbi:MAG: hypothetical protein ACTSRP_02015 [Candidatus Helarchaeota archaeon]
MDRFYPSMKSIEIAGETIEIPERLTFKQEVQFLNIVQKMLKKGLKDINLEETQLSPTQGIEIVIKILTSAPDELQRAASLILNKPLKWVEENCNLTDILKVIVPFFILFMNNINQVMSGLLEMSLPNLETQMNLSEDK